MQTIAVHVTVPAELKKVSDGLIQLVADIKAGKKSAELADSVALVEEAVTNLGELKEELSSPALPVLGGLMAGQLVSALMVQPAPAAAPAPAPSTPA